MLSHSGSRGLGATLADYYTKLAKENCKLPVEATNLALIGAGLDEAPMAYKDINLVMEAQKELIDVVAKFTPKMVRMAHDGSRED
ncbi:RtcB family protein [Pedobacter gandavensis]|uniref:RtcB family protein n=1 Tax=Pedobacter gandavensis TaxID=2679963 RepID=UPI001F4107CD|nr:RtcB family protein [Pedobacter gandavensis]